MTSIKPPAGPPTAAHIPAEMGPSAPADIAERAGEIPGNAATSAPQGAAESHAVSQDAGAALAPQAATASSAPESSAAVASASGLAGPAGSAGSAGDALAELAGAVERGQLSMAQALDQLVERTLGGLAQQLTETDRGELSGLLRSALASDPTFSALHDEPG